MGFATAQGENKASEGQEQDQSVAQGVDPGCRGRRLVLGAPGRHGWIGEKGDKGINHDWG